MLSVTFQNAAPDFLETFGARFGRDEIFQLLELQLSLARDGLVTEALLFLDTACERQRRRLDFGRVQRSYLHFVAAWVPIEVEVAMAVRQFVQMRQAIGDAGAVLASSQAIGRLQLQTDGGEDAQQSKRNSRGTDELRLLLDRP